MLPWATACTYCTGIRKTGPGRKDCGGGFVLSPSACTAWKNFHKPPIQTYQTCDEKDRLTSLAIQFKCAKGMIVFIFSTYAPDCSKANNENLDDKCCYKDYHEDLQTMRNTCSPDNVLIIATDANYKLWVSESHSSSEGNFSYKRSNERGNFFDSNKPWALNTF